MEREKVKRQEEEKEEERMPEFQRQHIRSYGVRRVPIPTPTQPATEPTQPATEPTQWTPAHDMGFQRAFLIFSEEKKMVTQDGHVLEKNVFIQSGLVQLPRNSDHVQVPAAEMHRRMPPLLPPLRVLGRQDYGREDWRNSPRHFVASRTSTRKVVMQVPGSRSPAVHYQMLKRDVFFTESGMVQVPRYPDDMEVPAAEEVHRGMPPVPPPPVKKGRPWTEDEHRLFLSGLEKYGKGDWKNISRNSVISKSPSQVASHAQKFFLRQNASKKERKRRSIHDITMFPDNHNWDPLPDVATQELQELQQARELRQAQELQQARELRQAQELQQAQEELEEAQEELEEGQ